MVKSRRGRIIELLSEGCSDKEIIQTIDVEFPPGTFSTSNMKALYGTKWDLGKTKNQSKPHKSNRINKPKAVVSRQGKTGDITEEWVEDKIRELGLNSYKPVPDRGVDFVITCPKKPSKKLKIQVKGRGKIQQNEKYRWFQIRTTKKQREKTVEEGFPLTEAWRKKAVLVDIFIFVSELYHEFWIFESKDIENLILANRLNTKHGNRKDNRDGRQAEIDLDVEHNGRPLTEIYIKNLNNWDLITNRFT